ncbi:MAG: hydrolase [Nitrospirae bacterium GWC2_57_13]|jgi:putative phosphoribosyl transferase|nr:MAG: hydrolase [Nitrospirae bacterium GWC2_57_13]OGW44881.1 MAG: hydrolase [Nitrospirae bacterium GWD2_57_8]
MEQSIHIPVNSVALEGDLNLLPDGKAVVLFAHGSGSSRLSPRNRFVAEVLRDAGIGTLLFDLLTKEEDRTYDNRFDISLLAHRLKAATLWLLERPATGELRAGYFGASTGAAAALVAAAELGPEIGAVVSRGGRPDLAGSSLGQVQAPTLFIVGERDEAVIEMNRQALALINAQKELKIIPRATHLFEEPGTLEEAARLAAAWFRKHLVETVFGRG